MPTRGRSPTRSGSRARSRRRVSRSSSSIVRQPSRSTSSYLWGPNTYLSKYYDPFPAKGHFVLRYSDQITLNPTVGANAFYHFRANSIYDPDYSSAGHQPYGHDNLEGIYKSYVVDKAVMTLVPTQFGNTVATYGARVAENVVTPTFNTIRETKGITMATTAVGARSPSITRTYERGKMWPIEKDTSAVFGANPEGHATALFSLFMQGPNESTDAGSVDFIVNITYYITCFELKQLNGS